MIEDGDRNDYYERQSAILDYEWTQTQIAALRKMQKQEERRIWFEYHKNQIFYCLCLASFLIGWTIGTIMK